MTKSFMSMQCPYCRGRGWQWIGVASNAYRAECEECGGKGRGQVKLGPLLGLACCVVSAAFVLGMLWMLL